MFRMSNMKSRARYGAKRGTLARASVSATRRQRGKGIAARVYKNRVPGRNGSYQIPRGFVGLAGDAKFIEIPNGQYGMGLVDADALLITYLSTIPQNATVNGRIGKACQAQSLSVRGQVIAGTAGIAASYHIYWVWDYQPNKVLAAFADIFVSKANNTLPNRSYNARFKILKKITGTILGNSTLPTTGQEVNWIETIVPMPADGFIQYEQGTTSGLIGTCIQGALLQVCISDSASATSRSPVFDATMRLNFKDISP